MAIFTDSFWPSIDGASILLQQLVSDLAAQGHGCAVFYPYTPNGGGGGPEFAGDVRLFPLPSVPYTRYPDYRIMVSGLMRSIRSLRGWADVVHITSPFTSGWIGITTARAIRTPTVGTFFTNVFSFVGGAIPTVRETLLGLLVRKVYNRCSVVTVPTAYVGEMLEGRGLVKPVIEVPGGITLLRRSPHRDGPRDGAVTIGYVGRLSQEKEVDVLMEAFPLVKREFPRARLLVIGDGPDRSRLLRIRSSMAYGDDVEMVGAVRPSLVDGYVSKMTLLVSPGSNETQGMSLLQALGAGTPGVVPNVRPLTDLIVDGVNGVVFKKGDPEDLSEKVIDALGTMDLSTMSRRAIETASRYDRSKLLNRWITLYESLASIGYPDCKHLDPYKLHMKDAGTSIAPALV